MEHFWEKGVDIIKEKVTKQNFETWISPVRISSMDGAEVELSVPNRFFRDWLTDHYLGIIKESLSSIAGMQMNVRFIIDKTPAQGKKIVELPAPVVAPVLGNKVEQPPRYHPSLNPNYHFERFVVGPSNQFAHAAAVAVAEAPAKNYN
ncbi:MAG TPA: DnaA N-terminal domain-containing protein, partial [Syntrophales bacterium]|nr:DnaA N-terminal domain-containing protein [Syntrophales bacterium]